MAILEVFPPHARIFQIFSTAASIRSAGDGRSLSFDQVFPIAATLEAGAILVKIIDGGRPLQG